MSRGENLIKAGILDLNSTTRHRPLELVLRRSEPAACVFASSISPSRRSSAEFARLGLILSKLAYRDVPVRLVVVEQPPGPDEHHFRLHLRHKGLAPDAFQARLEIVDGTLLPIAVGDRDFFAAVNPEYARLLDVRLQERGLNPSFDTSLDLAEALTRHWDVSTHFDFSPDASPANMRSSWGLKYHVLKEPPASYRPRRTCLFVHFDPAGRIDPHVVRYLAALQAYGLETILISSNSLDVQSLEAAQALTVAIVQRENKGLDFTGWALAIELFPNVLGSEILIIANDSVYGPVGDLGVFFDRMETEGLDVCGGVESTQIGRHFQSWLVAFRGNAIRSETFREFWSKVLPMTDKEAIVLNYEVPLWRTFQDAGFQVGAAVRCKGHGLHDTNPMMEGWREMLDSSAPFIKVQLLRDNVLSSSLTGWFTELNSRGYPAHLILDHLYRIRGRRAAALEVG